MKAADFDKAILDVYLRDEELAGEVLSTCLRQPIEDTTDGPYFTRIAEECQKRGIDPAKALEKAWKRQADFLKLFE